MVRYVEEWFGTCITEINTVGLAGRPVADAISEGGKPIVGLFLESGPNCKYQDERLLVEF